MSSLGEQQHCGSELDIKISFSLNHSKCLVHESGISYLGGFEAKIQLG